MATPPSRPVSPVEWIARIVALVVLVPVRLLWEGVRLVGRVTAAALGYVFFGVLIPAARFLWYWVIRPVSLFFKNIVWGWLLQQVLLGLVLTPLFVLLLDFVLRPLRRAVEEWLWRRVLLPALEWLWETVLRPTIKVLALVTVWLTYRLIVLPLTALWRWVIQPLWRLLRTVLTYAWEVATVVVGVLVVTPCRALYRHVLRPVLVAFAAVWAAMVVRPLRWVYAHVLSPVNKWAAEILNTVFAR